MEIQSNGRILNAITNIKGEVEEIAHFSPTSSQQQQQQHHQQPTLPSLINSVKSVKALVAKNPMREFLKNFGKKNEFFRGGESKAEILLDNTGTLKRGSLAYFFKITWISYAFFKNIRII